MSWAGIGGLLDQFFRQLKTVAGKEEGRAQQPFCKLPPG